MALACAGVLLGAVPASAASTYTVVNTLGAVTDVGSLPWAVGQANADPGSTIKFDDVVSGTIVITDLMVITESVTITGPGSTVLEIDAPGTVFEITPTTPTIDVLITGLSMTDSSGTVSACGIDAVETRLTLLDIVTHDFDCSGIYVQNGSLTATDVKSNSNGAGGIDFTGYDALDTLSLTRVEALDNGDGGIYAALTDGTATTDQVTTRGGVVFGFQLGGTGMTAAISNVRVENAGIAGFLVFADTGSTATVSDVFAGPAPGDPPTSGIGMVISSVDGSTVTATRMTASDNEAGGLEIIGDDATVTVSGSLFENNGVSGGCGCLGGGGGISINSGALGSGTDSTIAITGTRVLGNFAGSGAGISLGDFEGDSSLTISDSVISGNVADSSGGGFYAQDLGYGTATGQVAFVRTTLSSNEATTGAGVQIDGLSHTSSGAPQLLFDSTTVSGNIATGAVGGIFATKFVDSGGLGIVRMINTTVSGNSSAGPASGLATVATPGLSTDEMRTEVLHSTIASNTGDIGATFLGAQSVAFSHTIVADNPVGDLLVAIDDPSLFVIDHTLVEAPQSPAIPAIGGNIVGVDPALGPLANNGGPTLTHLIAPGSAAYNAGNPAIAGAPLYDQRGLTRIYQTIDLGAVEWHPALAATGTKPEPEPGLVGLLFLFTGIALVAASRRFAL